MELYLKGGFGYYTTMPTDALTTFRDVMQETQVFGLGKAKAEFVRLGAEVRAMMLRKGFKSVATDGFKAPGVVVSYTTDPQMFAKFKKVGLQTAAGVPFMLDEPSGMLTFRIGLFGLDKVLDVNSTVATLEKAIDSILAA